MFSEKALEYLTAAGWSENRKIDTDIYKAAYKKEGFRFPKKVNEFLSSFGGLIIEYPYVTTGNDILEFYADHAVKGCGPPSPSGCTMWEDVSDQFGVSSYLYPLGHYTSGLDILLMDVRGRVFAGSDCNFQYVGKDEATAIENILTTQDNIKFILF